MGTPLSLSTSPRIGKIVGKEYGCIMLYQTHARVHLRNIRANIEGIRNAIGGDRKILLSVKANAYGHGAVEVGRMAERIGVEWLGVATVPEGILLRSAGIRLPILKLSPAFPEEMRAALEYGITLPVCDRESVLALRELASAAGKAAPVHLKVDTGMGRVGVEPEGAAELASFIERECPALRLEGVFTHLPVSDERNTAYTAAQIGRFKSVVDSVSGAIGRRVSLAHCSNSGAVLGHKEAWMDMVRPGIMVYGQYPDDGTPRSMQLLPGMSVKTRVAFIKKVKAGTGIGYGLSWTAPEDTTIATIPAGYADGFNRLFSNRGRVLVNGRSYPVAGRVCMDQTMIDLGPETDVRVGDEVVLMGRSGDQEISCAEWARLLGTISYEVTCQINCRVERVYDEY